MALQDLKNDYDLYSGYTERFKPSYEGFKMTAQKLLNDVLYLQNLASYDSNTTIDQKNFFSGAVTYLNNLISNLPVLPF